MTNKITSNIFIGFSLGNKYFSKLKLKEYIELSLKETDTHLLLIVPDRIHAINYEIRNGYSYKRSLNVALRKGKDMFNTLNMLVQGISLNGKCIHIITWDKIIIAPDYILCHSKLLDEFNNNLNFRERILDIVRNNTPNSHYFAEDLEKLSEYVINELPLLLQGVEYEGVRYMTHFYPKFCKIHELVHEILTNTYYVDKFSLNIHQSTVIRIMP